MPTRTDYQTIGGDATTHTLTLNVGTNPDRAAGLWVRVDGARTISSVTIDGVAATLLDSASNSDILYALYGRAGISGTGNINAVVTFSSFGGTKRLQGAAFEGCASIRGGDVVIPGSNSNAPSVTLTTQSGDSVVLFGFDSGFGTTFTPASPATVLGSGSGAILAAEETATGASTTIDGTLTASCPWRAGAIAFAGAAPAAPVITGPTGSAGDATCAVNVAENQSTIGTWTATNGGTWSISGGADAARVAIDGSGVVTFVGGGKNFEAPDDADTNGTYLFTVQNAGAGGTVTQDVTATLTDVNEPPGAPTIGTATAGNASATVAFTPPAANGGPTPTSYTATSSPGGITGTGASSPIAVSGLTNGVEYTFSVTATNSEGTGPASAASNAVTPAAVTYSITSPAGGFAPNTGSGARAAGTAFNWWAFAGKQIGESLSGATIQTGSGTLNGSGQAVLSGLTLSGSWECQVRFADGGTARWTGTAA